MYNGVCYKIKRNRHSRVQRVRRFLRYADYRFSIPLDPVRRRMFRRRLRVFMLTVGLTGSTGSGKGYVSDIMIKAGIPCLDTDQVCRDVYRKGEPCYFDLVSYFGEEILREDGEIDRSALFHLAFPDKEKYEKLNSIAFFHIMKVTERWLTARREEGERVVVIDAPMLFESGFDRECDITLGVIANRDIRIDRIMKRDSISEKRALARIENQKDDSWFFENCDYVIVNDGCDISDQINYFKKEMIRLYGEKEKKEA